MYMFSFYLQLSSHFYHFYPFVSVTQFSCLNTVLCHIFTLILFYNL